MTVLRVLLAAVWLLFGFAAGAHAQPSAPPCHMAMTTHHAPAPSGDPGVMPCCSQPALIAPDAVLVPQARRVAPLRLSPSPVRVMTGLSTPAEPRPPKNA